MTPVLNKLLKIQILIQKKVKGIVFDNDTKGATSGSSVGSLSHV
jgi:hypothetical protein